MSEIKVGDDIRIDGVYGVHTVKGIMHEHNILDTYSINGVDMNFCKKVYVSDTPPPETHQLDAKTHRAEGKTHQLSKNQAASVEMLDLIEDISEDAFMAIDFEKRHLCMNKFTKSAKNTLRKHLAQTPQITQTEVQIKSGHMAGYGVDDPKVVQFSPINDSNALIVLYSNGMMFEACQGVWKEILLPHDKKKHLFK